MSEEDFYTQDGTVNIHKKPADKRKTGNWKACPYILGLFSLVPCMCFFHCVSSKCLEIKPWFVLL